MILNSFPENIHSLFKRTRNFYKTQKYLLSCNSFLNNLLNNIKIVPIFD